MKTPPKPKQLIELGYMIDRYNRQDLPDHNETITHKQRNKAGLQDKQMLSRAYKRLENEQPEQYQELLRFDSRQACRDWVYEKRTELLGNPVEPDTESVAEYIESLGLHSKLLDSIVLGLINNDTQQEMADDLNVSRSTVCRGIEKIKDKLAGEHDILTVCKELHEGVRGKEIDLMSNI